MTPESDDPGAILVGEAEPEIAPPECRVAGCDRPGAVSREVSDPDDPGETYVHYVCRFHHRVLVAIKVGVGALAVAVFLWAAYATV